MNVKKIRDRAHHYISPSVADCAGFEQLRQFVGGTTIPPLDKLEKLAARIGLSPEEIASWFFSKPPRLNRWAPASTCSARRFTRETARRMQALTKVLFHQHAEYDPESGLLHSSNKEPPQPICGPGFPVRYDPEKAACYPPPFKRGAREGVQPARQGPQPLTAEPPPPPKTRPGWAVD